MRRRPQSLDLDLDDAEFQALKRIRKRPVDYRNARLIVEEVFVREIVDQLGVGAVGVSLRVRVDETVEDVESFVRAELESS